MQVIKLGLERKGEHIHVTVFMGEEGQILANCGKLVMHIGEWQLFGAMLTLGEEPINRNWRHGHLIIEGEEEALNPRPKGRKQRMSAEDIGKAFKAEGRTKDEQEEQCEEKGKE